jgi:hypothetical protein
MIKVSAAIDGRFEVGSVGDDTLRGARAAQHRFERCHEQNDKIVRANA